MMFKKNKKYLSFWKAKPLKERLSEPASVLFLIFIGFYLIQLIISFFSKILPPLIDFFTVMLILTITFILHLNFKFKKTVPVFGGIGFFFHIIGLYKIIPYNQYYTGTLYGAPQLNYHYDWIVHSVGFGFLAIAFCSMLYPYFRISFKNKFMIFLLMLFAMLGASAINEMLEFAGYTVFGYGEGFMEFGEGDISPDAGPWQNSSMDLVSNLIGGFIAVGFFVLIKEYRERKSKEL